MGVAQENRFKKLSRQYFDEQQNAPEVRQRQYLAKLEDEVTALRAALRETEAELSRAKDCVKRQRIYLTEARNQLSAAKANCEAGHREMMKWFRAFQDKDRAWRKLSRMVRELCSPETVRSWREDSSDKEAA